MKTALTWIEPAQAERRVPPIQKLYRKQVVRESTPVDVPDSAVSVLGYQYLVDFGAGTAMRYHRVNKAKACSCGAPYCDAIEAVRQYLQAGGARAPDPPPEFNCPICGGKTYPDHRWDGKYTKMPGWRCEKGGVRHFLEAKGKQVQQQLAENPWLIPPAEDYPGVRRDEVLTFEECEAISRKVFLETGYDPTQ
jgi:hypothetical protein